MHFEKDAMQALSSGAQEFARVENVNGNMVYRRATPDLASVQACVNCHEGKTGRRYARGGVCSNSHGRTPWLNWTEILRVSIWGFLRSAYLWSDSYFSWSKS